MDSMASSIPSGSPHQMLSTEGRIGSSSQKAAGTGRDVAQESRAFHHAGPHRVGHHHVAGAHRLHQAGNADPRFAAQFQRVTEIVIHAPQDHIHLLQSGQGLQEDLLVAHGQVAAFGQRESQVPR
jgi:hypothetical protein